MKSRENRRRRQKRNDKFIRRVLAERWLGTLCEHESKNSKYYEVEWGRFHVKTLRDGRRFLDRERSSYRLVPNSDYKLILTQIADHMKGKSFTFNVDGQEVELSGDGKDVALSLKRKEVNQCH